MATPTLTTETTIRPSSNSRGRAQVVFDWVRSWRLAILAALSWAFTIGGLVADYASDISTPTLVGIFMLAYLGGGTLATGAAISDLLDRKINVDLLMVLAAVGAAALGSWTEGAILLSLFSTSNALEHHALDKTRNAVRLLMDLTPPTARVERDRALRIIPVEELRLDDVIIVQPGEKIPADARVLSGSSTVDQAAITGESIPAGKIPGDTVFAGTINGHGALQARVTRLSTESTLARIVKLVEEAREQKSKLEQFADSFEGRYAAAVIVFSLLVATVPILFGVDPGDAFYRGMTLLVVMSPCALVISTPAATLSALANAARRGVLVKGGRSLETLGTVDTIAFDKTGTLTVGRPRLTDVVMLNGADPGDILARAAAAEQLSEHPIGTAIVEAARYQELILPPSSDLEAHVGRGITARVNGEVLAIGNERLFRDLGIDLPKAAVEHQNRLGEEGKSTMIVGDRAGVYAVLAVADTLRPGVRETVAALRKAGVKRTVMLTGDNALVANAIARSVGIDEVHADLLPEEKLAVIETLKASGKVAMIGDGVNDAPALAMADVGISMGGAGSDVALETSDVVLMSDDLGKLYGTISLSRAMRKTIRANLTFALSIITVLAISTLIVGIPLPLGVVGHEGSTVVVVLNGLRLLAHGGNFTLRARPQGSDQRRDHHEAPQYRLTIA
ncbi:MAG TPA: heavy metal translocating P-type ATPase [Thermomicrobiales bacterium]|nr:heavy metal translocating P-type ATPase [Thermomicrobiales bacterium]